MNTEIRELNDAELEAVSGAKSVSYHDGFKFTLHDNGDIVISAGGIALRNDSQGQPVQVTYHTTPTPQ